jgi:uncharacterized protein with ATP-grasp and redox domains
MECNLKQLVKISNLLQVSDIQKEQAAKRLFKVLSTVDYNQTNPEIMEKTWQVITSEFNNDNPYKEIKESYNNLLLSIYEETKQIINKADNQFITALKIAVIGNIIDFGARHQFDKEMLLKQIRNSHEIIFQIDYVDQLKSFLEKGKQLLYIGDNCGEIVLDKIFIETIKEMFPNLKMYFSVRGKPILNDITIEDAEMVKMDEVVDVISSGAQIPGTVLSKSSKEFQDIFHSSDVIIAKGQGNYESLSDVKRKGLFLLLMSKCDFVSKTLGVKTMDYVVIHNDK